MSLQDRDYTYEHAQQTGYGGERYERRGLPHWPRTAVGWLLLINIAVYLVDWLTSSSLYSTYGTRLTNYLALPSDTIYHPLQWYRFLTCGFAHAPEPAHIICNMLMLFFMGPPVERRYGVRSFLFVYLTLIIFSALFWSAGQGFGSPYQLTLPNGIPLVDQTGNPILRYPQIVGASGAITGIVILFALNWPRQQVLLFFIIPLPMWVVAAFIIISDMSGALGHPVAGVPTGIQNVAFSAHIGGAIGAFLWWKFCADRTGFEKFLDRLTPARWRWSSIGGAHIHSVPTWRKRPSGTASNTARGGTAGWSQTDTTASRRTSDPQREVLDREVDRILRKYSESGPDSLTPEEMKTLQRASETYRQL